MEYLTHQRRLLPALATTYAMQLQSLRLKVLPDFPFMLASRVLQLSWMLALCGMSLGTARRKLSLAIIDKLLCGCPCLC